MKTEMNSSPRKFQSVMKVHGHHVRSPNVEDLVHTMIWNQFNTVLLPVPITTTCIINTDTFTHVFNATHFMTPTV